MAVPHPTVHEPLTQRLIASWAGDDEDPAILVQALPEPLQGRVRHDRWRLESEATLGDETLSAERCESLRPPADRRACCDQIETAEALTSGATIVSNNV